MEDAGRWTRVVKACFVVEQRGQERMRWWMMGDAVAEGDLACSGGG